MKLKTLLMLVVIALIVALAMNAVINIVMRGSCRSGCLIEDITCDNNDNNCVGGQHYCYDLCVGGTTVPNPFAEEFKYTPIIFTFLLLLIVIYQSVSMRRRDK